MREIRKEGTELALGQQSSKVKGGLFRTGGYRSLKRHIQYSVISNLEKKTLPF